MFPRGKTTETPSLSVGKSSALAREIEKTLFAQNRFSLLVASQLLPWKLARNSRLKLELRSSVALTSLARRFANNLKIKKRCKNNIKRCHGARFARFSLWRFYGLRAPADATHRTTVRILLWSKGGRGCRNSCARRRIRTEVCTF